MDRREQSWSRWTPAVALAVVMVFFAGAGSGIAAAAAPTVTDVNSNNGSESGGKVVTVTGTGFIKGSTVKFGEASATSVVINSTTSITATSPAGSGTAHVRVTNSEGTSASVADDQYAYDPPPTLRWLGLNANFGDQGFESAQKFSNHEIVYDAGYKLEWEAGDLPTPESWQMEYLGQDVGYGMKPVITIEPVEFNPEWGSPLPKGAAIEEYVEGFVETASAVREELAELQIVFQPINEPYGHGTASEYAAIIAQLLPAAQKAGIPLEDIYVAAYGREWIGTQQWVPAMYAAQPSLKSLVGGWYFHPYGPAEGEDELHRERIQSIPTVQQYMTSGQNNIIISEVGYWTPDVNGGTYKGGPPSSQMKNSEEAAAALTKMLTNAEPMHDAGWLKALLVYGRTPGGWAMEDASGYTAEGAAFISFADWSLRPRVGGTETATNVTSGSATLFVEAVYPDGAPATYQFEYGATESYGTKAPVPAFEAVGTSAAEAKEEITGLEPATTYHFRITATNEYGTTHGPDHVFTTPQLLSHTSSFGTSGSGNGQLSLPADAAIDSSGNIWVVDRGNNRVEKFNSKGEYASQFGAKGTGNGQFEKPSGIAIDSSGNIWVTDANNGRVEKFNAKGEYVTKFGSKGTGSGQFSSWGPKGIAADSSGNVWIGDYSGRIQKFNSAGEFVKAVGSKGTGNGQFEESAGIDIGPEGKIWVSDYVSNRVTVFNAAGEYLFKFGTTGSGNGQLNAPDALEVDTKGNVWVGEEGNSRVQEFNQAGEYVTKFGSKGSGAEQFSFAWPFGITSDDKGGLVIADVNNNRIQRWTVAEYVPSYQSSFGVAGSGNGQLSLPADAAVDSSGSIWVADRGNNRVEKFNSKGEYVTKFGAKGTGNGQFEKPSGIAIDSAGNIWVADATNERIQKFNAAGEFLLKFGSKGTANGQFSTYGPKGLAVDSGGNIWVSDYSGRIQKFNSAGEFVKAVGSSGTGNGQFEQSAGIDFGPEGKIWVADYINRRVSVFSAAGEFLFKFGASGTGPGQFSAPDGLEVDAKGNVFVEEEGTSRVQEFNQAGDFVTQFGSNGSGAGQFQFTWPFALTSDAGGNLWIPDVSNNRVQRWRYRP